MNEVTVDSDSCCAAGQLSLGLRFMVVDGLEQARSLMQRAGMDPTAIAVFANSYQQLAAGGDGPAPRG